jgi:glutamate carboxypeptidase
MDDTLVQRPDRTDMLAALERLVLAESPSTDKARCDACADEVAELFRQRTGVSAIRHRRTNAGDHLEVRIGEGAEPIVLLCHHDTVWREGTLGRLPFGVEGDRVTGPGGYDMKAGIVEAAFALEQARPRRPVVVLSTSDEEIGSVSSRTLIEETARHACAVLVLEPAASGGAIKTARKGIADFVLEVDGRAAHAGVEPEKGISAIEELAHQVLALRALADPASGTTINVGVVHGGTRPNVVAAQARAEIDVRFARAAEAERVTTAIRGLQPRLQGARLRISGGIDRPPMERSPGVVRLAELAQRLAGDVGFRLMETSTGGASDGNFTAALGVPTLDGLGPDGGGAHADSEHLLVESWLQRTALLRLMIEAL